jgi:hypothetical protein
MNALTEHLAGGESASHAGVAPALHVLRRTGRKAVRFTGWHIVEARGGEQGTMWYDLSIYRSIADSIVVELIARRAELDAQDMHRVEILPDLRAAANWLEQFECGNDVPIAASLAAGDGPMAACVLQAVQLRQLIARIRDDYQGLLSEVFEALDLTAGDSPDGADAASPQEQETH